MWTNIVERGRLQMTIWCIRIECWVPKATNAHTHVVYYSLVFPLQQWLHESSSVLRHTYIACLVLCKLFVSEPV